MSQATISKGRGIPMPRPRKMMLAQELRQLPVSIGTDEDQHLILKLSDYASYNSLTKTVYAAAKVARCKAKLKQGRGGGEAVVFVWKKEVLPEAEAA